MKKILLFVVFLAACSTSQIVDEDPCAAPDSTYPAAYTEEWKGVSYQLPWCWTATDNISNLQLNDGDSDSFVRMTFSSEENEDPGVASQEKSAPNGETLYLYFKTADFEDAQVQEILYSIQFTAP